MDVFDLSASLRLDTNEYEQGLNTAEGQGKGFLSKFGGVMKKGAVAGAALAGVGAAVGAGFIKAAKSTADYGDRVDKMSQKIGISAESYQKWDYVMQRAGGNVDSLKMGMKTLSQQAEKNSDSFQKLGISQEEVKNSSQEELFEKTVKGLSEMEAGTERTALATELLGRAGADMGPLLNQGSDAISEQMEIAEKYGMVMSDETVKASAAWEDSITTMQMTATGLKNRLMGEFLPSLTQVTDGLAKVFAGDMSGLDDIQAGIDAFIGKLGQALPKVLEIGGKIIGNLAMSIINNLPQLMQTGFQIVGQIGSFILNNLDTIINVGIDLMVNLAVGLAQAIPQIIAAIPQIIAAIVKAFKGRKKELKSAGVTLIKSLGNGIKSMAKFVGSVALSLAKRIPSMIKKGVKALPSIGKTAIKALGTAIKGLAGFVASIAKALAKKAVDAIRNGLKALARIGRSAIKSLASAIKNGVSTVESAAKSLGKKAVSAVKDGLSNIASAGKALVEGLWAGMQGATDWLKNLISGWVGDVKAFLKKLFGINSPSKWARDVIGLGIVEGMAKGITDNTDMVDDALEDLMPDVDPEIETTNVTGGTFVPAMQAMMAESVASMAGSIAPDMAEAMAEALEGVQVKLNKREFGRLTRGAVNGAI